MCLVANKLLCIFDVGAFDIDWIKCCTTMEIDKIKQRGDPKKMRWDCVKEDMKWFGLSQMDAQVWNKCRRKAR